MSRGPRSLPSLRSNGGSVTTKVSTTAVPTVSLAKRLLFPTLAPNEPLPPLLSSPTTPPELTAELYDFIALALRAFVLPFWSKLSRYDKEFVPEIGRILVTVFRSLESRLYTADLAPLLFRDIPTLVNQHYVDHRNAQDKVSTTYAVGGAASLDQLFHQLQPHMALSAEGRIDEEYFRQVIDHILKTCLPEEDYAPETERFIVREILLKVVVKDVIPKITQPWFILKVICDLMGPEADVPPTPTTVPEKTSSKSSPLSPTFDEPEARPTSSPFAFHTLIVFFLSAVQTLSGACLALIHAYKHAMNTIREVNASATDPHATGHVPSEEHRSEYYNSGSYPPTPYPPRQSMDSARSSSGSSIDPPNYTSHMRNESVMLGMDTPFGESTTPAPDYARPALTLVATILSTANRFASTALVNSLTMITVAARPFLDRLLPHVLHTNLNASFALNIVRIAKRTLFPNGYPGPAPPDPTPEEQAHMKARIEAWRGKGGLAHAVPLLLGPNPTVTLRAALAPMSSQACNVHLIVLILDRVIGTLFPELVTGGDGPGPVRGHSPPPPLNRTTVTANPAKGPPVVPAMSPMIQKSPSGGGKRTGFRAAGLAADGPSKRVGFTGTRSHRSASES